MQKTIKSLENIDGFTTNYWAVHFDNGIAFDYSQHLIAILIKEHISLYHISQIREWQLQSTPPTRDPHGNIKGEHNFRIWLRIRDIDCPEVSAFEC